MSSAKIRAVAFKESGKYYSETTGNLTEAHSAIYGFELLAKIKADEPDVRSLCPISGGWNYARQHYHILIEVDYGPRQNFCTYLMPIQRGEG